MVRMARSSSEAASWSSLASGTRGVQSVPGRTLTPRAGGAANRRVESGVRGDGSVETVKEPCPEDRADRRVGYLAPAPSRDTIESGRSSFTDPSRQVAEP
jgi:hypothetical protein